MDRKGLHSAGVAVFSAFGALLFGFDIGYIAPILECASFKRDVAGLQDWEDPTSEIPSGLVGFVVSIFSVGCIITSFPGISGTLSDGFGRRASIVFASLAFLVGCVLQAMASSIADMLAGRIIAGFSIGLLSSVVPMYQSEVAHPDMRGALVSVYQLMVTLGILIAAWLDMLLVPRDNGWRFAVAAQAIPACALIVGMACMPPSPRWLVQRGESDEALKVLLTLREEADARNEWQGIVENHDATSKLGEPAWADLFRGRVAKLLVLGVVMQLLQQLVGMNAFMYFGPRIFRGLGLAENRFQTINNGINFLATFPAIFLADRCGRRSLLIWSAAGMTTCCTVMGVVGTKFAVHTDEGYVVSDGAAGMTIAASIFGFVINFAYGWGPIVWVYTAEIFPLRYRGRCLGLTAMANWVGNFAVAQFTPVLLERFGFGTFFIFGVFSLAALMLSTWIPETGGVVLERVGMLFDEKLGVDRWPAGYGGLDDVGAPKPGHVERTGGRRSG